MAIFAGESPLMLSGDAKKDLELIRNYIYERDMELRHILSHLDESNFVEGFADRLATVNNITNEYNETIEDGDEPSGSVDLANATGILPVANGGTGRETLTVGSFLRGNGSEIALATPATVLEEIGAQGKLTTATAATSTAGVVGGKDISLATYTEYDPIGNVMGVGRYSSSYGYGIKCNKAGKYLISATANVKLTSDTVTTVTIAIRKVVGGEETYVAKANHLFRLANDCAAIAITPRVVVLEENSYLGMYNSSNTTSTMGEGCWLTAVYLGE